MATPSLPSEWQRSVGVLVALVVGAVLGALAATQSPSWVLAAVVIPEAAGMIYLPRTTRLAMGTLPAPACCSSGSPG